MLDRLFAQSSKSLAGPPARLALRRNEHHEVVRRPECQLGERKEVVAETADKVADLLWIGVIVVVAAPGGEMADAHRPVAHVEPVADVSEDFTILAGTAEHGAELVAVFLLRRDRDFDALCLVAFRGRDFDFGVMDD